MTKVSIPILHFNRSRQQIFSGQMLAFCHPIWSKTFIRDMNNVFTSSLRKKRKKKPGKTTKLQTTTRYKSQLRNCVQFISSEIPMTTAHRRPMTCTSFPLNVLHRFIWIIPLLFERFERIPRAQSFVLMPVGQPVHRRSCVLFFFFLLLLQTHMGMWA